MEFEFLTPRCFIHLWVAVLFLVVTVYLFKSPALTCTAVFSVHAILFPYKLPINSTSLRPY